MDTYDILLTITCDLGKNTAAPQVISINQNEANIKKIQAEFVSGGKPWEIPDGFSCNILMKKSDGFAVDNPAESISGNTALFNITPQMTVATGENFFQIQAIKSADDVRSFAVSLYVQKAVLSDNEIISESELKTVEETIREETNKWLDDHPEATTTVQDGSIDEIKLTDSLRKKKASFYDTVAAMQADTSLKAGMTCVTSGYFALNDEGGAQYYITAEKSESVRQEALNNGLYANLIYPDAVNIKTFGAYGDGVTDDTGIFSEALSDANIKEILVPDGAYLLSTGNLYVENKTITGCGGKILVPHSGGNTIFRLKPNAKIINLHFYNPETSAGYSTNACISVATFSTDPEGYNYFNFKIMGCSFENVSRRCINLYSARDDDGYTPKQILANGLISQCKFRNVGGGVIQSGVDYINISENIFENAYGVECITVDNRTRFCTISNNFFHGSAKGTGIIGADDSEACIFSGNTFKNTGTLPSISLNCNTGSNENIIINGNVFSGGDYNIRLKNPTDSDNPNKSANGCIISNNTFASSVTAPVIVQNIGGELIFDNNKYYSVKPLFEAPVNKNVVTDWLYQMDVSDKIDTSLVTPVDMSYGIKNGLIIAYFSFKALKELTEETQIISRLPINPLYQQQIESSFRFIVDTNIFVRGDLKTVNSGSNLFFSLSVPYK